MTIKKAAPRQKLKKEAKAILLCVAILAGSMALSPMKACRTINPSRASPNTTSKAIIRPFDHAYVRPPIWRARRRQIIEGMNRRFPKGSNFFNIDPQLSSLAGTFPSNFRKNSTPTAVTAPNGRLMKKHQRQLTWSVRPPPIYKTLAE